MQPTTPRAEAAALAMHPHLKQAVQRRQLPLLQMLMLMLMRGACSKMALHLAAAPLLMRGAICLQLAARGTMVLLLACF